MALLHEMYERYALEFLRVSRPRDSTALRFEPYDAAPPETDRASRPAAGLLGTLTPLVDPSMS
jgi:hypothetical protein